MLVSLDFFNQRHHRWQAQRQHVVEIWHIVESPLPLTDQCLQELEQPYQATEDY